MVKALGFFVHLANSQGGEIAVTLLVGGRITSGMLTPNERFLSWTKEVTLRAVHEKGQSQFPNVAMPPISKKEAEGIRAKWERIEQETKEEDPDAGSVLPEYEHLCLRNARVFAPFGPGERTYPYLLVSLSAVAAFTLGFYEGESDTQPDPGNPTE